MDRKKSSAVSSGQASSSSSSSLSSTKNDFLHEEKGSQNAHQCSVLWRGVNMVMVIFLLLAAYVQVNDPDPYVWIPVYTVPALLCLALVIKPSTSENAIWRGVCLIHISLCLIGALYLLSLVISLVSKGSASFLVYEEVRELLGMIIVIVWLSICRFASFSCSPRTDTKKGWFGAMLTMTCILGGFPLVFWSLCFIGPLHDRLDHCQEMYSAHI